MEEKTKYASYNGLNRVALVMGIPLMPFLIGAFLAVFLGFPALMMWGVVGILIPAVIFLGLFVLKLLCEDDPNAIDVIQWKIKGYFLKFRIGGKIMSFHSLRDNKEEKKDAKQYLKRFYRSAAPRL